MFDDREQNANVQFECASIAYWRNKIFTEKRFDVLYKIEWKMGEKAQSGWIARYNLPRPSYTQVRKVFGGIEKCKIRPGMVDEHPGGQKGNQKRRPYSVICRASRVWNSGRVPERVVGLCNNTVSASIDFSD